MLDSLDTLIGFALIFTVISLLATIVVQMIASLLNLRGKNLAWAVAETFEAIEPKLVAEVKGTGKKLADYVLIDPMLSDKQLFSNVGSATAVRPEELFDVLFRIATNKKQFALFPVPDGASPAEKEEIEKKNASRREKQTELDEMREHVLTFFEGLGLTRAQLNPDQAVLAVDDTVVRLRASLAAIPDGPEKQKALLALTAAEARVETIAAGVVTKVNALTAETQAQLQVAYQKFEAWIDTSEERAQEWFRTHTRIITLFVAFVFAIGLQLDTVEIFKMVSTNKAARDKLVAHAGVVIGQGEKILGDSDKVLADAFKQWKEGLTEQHLKNAINQAADLKVTETDTRDSFRRKVEHVLSPLSEKAPGKDQPTVTSDVATNALIALDTAIDTAARAALSGESANYKQMKDDLDKTGFDLFPPEGGRWTEAFIQKRRAQTLALAAAADSKGGAVAEAVKSPVPSAMSSARDPIPDPAGTSNKKSTVAYGDIVDSMKPHWLGIFASILLLSLGAPFWFNLLKSLANLRSSVAENIATEDKADEKHGSNPPPGVMPGNVVASTVPRKP